MAALFQGVQGQCAGCAGEPAAVGVVAGGCFGGGAAAAVVSGAWTAFVAVVVLRGVGDGCGAGGTELCAGGRAGEDGGVGWGEGCCGGDVGGCGCGGKGGGGWSWGDGGGGEGV